MNFSDSKNIFLSLLLISFTNVFSIIDSKQGTSQITFKENLGQISDQNYKPRPDVLFSGTDGKMNFHLKKTGISYQLYKIDKKEINPVQLRNMHSKEFPVPNLVSIQRIDIEWLDANLNCMIEKGEALPDYDNYYMEVCPNGVTGVKSYKEITYKNIYTGINLHYYSKEGGLKYDYIVAPHTDYKQIQLQINGAENISINENGELVIKSPLGDLIEQSPLVMQNGKRLIAKWIVTNNVVSFEIKNVNTNLQLIIDPLVRSWGTFYGGNSFAGPGYSICDFSGNIILCGNTDCNIGTTIATTGSYQSSMSGTSDCFVAKFNSAGLRQWATYYGGNGDEMSGNCTFDFLGNIYLCGGTNSVGGTGIATPGSHQSGNGGGSPVGADLQSVRFKNPILKSFYDRRQHNHIK